MGSVCGGVCGGLCGGGGAVGSGNYCWAGTEFQFEDENSLETRGGVMAVQPCGVLSFLK